MRPDCYRPQTSLRQSVTTGFFFGRISLIILNGSGGVPSTLKSGAL